MSDLIGVYAVVCGPAFVIRGIIFILVPNFWFYVLKCSKMF